MFQLKDLNSDVFKATNIGMKMMCELQETSTDCVESDLLDIFYQRNMLCLQTTTQEGHFLIEPKYVRQRSFIWYHLRKSASSTGNTLHSSIGLRGLKEQKSHFLKFLKGKKDGFSGL